MSIISKEANFIVPANNNAQNQVQFDELKAIVQNLSVLDGEGEINLTPIAKLFKKRIDTWKKTNSEILEEIRITLRTGATVLRQKMGGNGEQGTFTNNPDVFLEFLRYCSPKLAVAMTRIVRELFEKGKVELNPVVAPLPDNILLAQLLEQNNFYIKSLSTKNAQLEIVVSDKNAIIDDLLPKAQFVDEVLVKGNTGLSAMTIVAKEIGLGSVRLYKLLRDEKVWFWALNEHGVNENVVSQDYINNDCFVIKPLYSSRDGRTYDKIFATNKGKLLCHKLVKKILAKSKFEISLI